MLACELLAFMDWFDVSMKVSLLCCLIFTLCALKPLAFMDWIYVPLKIMFLQSFIITVWTFILFVHHVKNCWCYWIKSEFNNNVDKNLSVPKIKQKTDWSWNKLALIWGEAQLCLPYVCLYEKIAYSYLKALRWPNVTLRWPNVTLRWPNDTLM